MVNTDKEILNAVKDILVIDDEPAFRILFHKKLRAAGYHTIMAQNGEEALVALWEQHNIGLVLLDIRLPFMNGLNIFDIIRKDFPDKKIIVTSALQKDEQQFLINGADGYYGKSEDLSCLMEKVDDILNGKSKTALMRENEKRNFKRVPVNVLASCEFANNLTTPAPMHFFSYTKDLSLKGARFVIPEDTKVGQHFSAALELPANFLPLLIDCQVMWVRKMEEFDIKTKRNNEVGVRFVKLDLPQDEEKLQNYLNFI